ncbi:hypothetical protein M408DRAFT_112008 [Serendipita vermifera MAFF 305830]|uniref:Mediator of RNA polymerase II transcription subunit 5 n=1 Tax=Serendipita vermifera MAFF 305830 TaxID=933852 RepID=A0A0C2W3K0_SERVB|nr:hypothetical protein M408DRAFT_112008 [Serendipita vermifera MAFF 305830]
MEDITKKCFENGLSAQQWLQILQASPDLSNAIVPPIPILETILDLLAAWPANQLLVEYLAAIPKSQLLPVHAFVPVVLRATRKPELVDPRSLDMLCRLIVNTSAESPLSTLLSPVEPIEPLAMSLLDAYSLVRMALNSSFSPLHDFQSSSQDLLFLLLQYNQAVLAHLTPPEALQFLTVGHGILQQSGIRQDLASALEAVNRLLGELLTVADALPSAHPEIMSIGLPPPELPPAEISDLVCLSLYLRNIVDYRAHPYGCGNTDRVTATLNGLFKWSGSSASTFCAELVGASFLHFLESFQVRQAEPVGLHVWSSFVYGRLPVLLLQFTDAAGITPRNTTIQAAVATAFEKLQPQLDFALPFQTALDTEEGVTAIQNPAAFKLNFLHALVGHEVISSSDAVAISSDWMEENAPPAPLLAEITGSFQTIQDFIEGMILASPEELKRSLDLFVADPNQQRVFSEQLLNKFTDLSQTSDLTALSKLCEVLYTHPEALEILALNLSIPELLKICLNFVDSLDWENTDDPQGAIEPFGNVIMFLQSTIGRFKLSLSIFTSPDGSNSANYLMQMGTALSPTSLDLTETKTYDEWYKTLFDPSIDGVDESLVRSNNPKILLKLAPILLIEAIKACGDPTSGAKNLEYLRHGINYFQESLLCWTLAGVIRSVALEMERQGIHAPIHADVLQRLVKHAPACVLKMVQRTLSRVLSIPVNPETAKHREGLVTLLQTSLKTQNGQPTLSTYTHKLAPSGLIQAALMSMRSHRAVSLDVPLCLRTISTLDFLTRMQNELYSATHLGDQNATRHITVYALCPVAQAGPDQAWLLPIYLFVCVPRILDNTRPQDTLLIDSLSFVITSALRLSVCIDKSVGQVTPEPSSVVAEKFSQLLKKDASRDATTSQAALLKALQSSQPFCSQFPSFL